MSKKRVFPKNKSELDVLSRDQICDYRLAYVSQPNYPVKEGMRYSQELDLYMNTRFKEHLFDMYIRWEKRIADPKTDDLTKQALELITDVLQSMGHEGYYQYSIKTAQTKLGELQYII